MFFYYDFSFKNPCSDEDLEKIENKMSEIIDKGLPFVREVWERNDAIDYFNGIGEKYKTEIINDISSNTVIGVIATDAPLTRSNLKRIAIMAHDGIARSLNPAHTSMDGDTIFSITTRQNIKEQVLENVDIIALGARASDCVARACNRAIYEAKAVGNSKPSWKNLFQSK